MRRKRLLPTPKAEELTPEEVKQILLTIGNLIHKKRDERTSLERFAYEINVSRSQMTRYEDGADMRLSTFLRLIHGLDISGEDFFKEVRKKK